LSLIRHFFILQCVVAPSSLSATSVSYIRLRLLFFSHRTRLSHKTRLPRPTFRRLQQQLQTFTSTSSSVRVPAQAPGLAVTHTVYQNKTSAAPTPFLTPHSTLLLPRPLTTASASTQVHETLQCEPLQTTLSAVAPSQSTSAISASPAAVHDTSLTVPSSSSPTSTTTSSNDHPQL
jgi:hypothetical protein